MTYILLVRPGKTVSVEEAAQATTILVEDLDGSFRIVKDLNGATELKDRR